MNLMPSIDVVDFPPNNYIFMWRDVAFLCMGLATFLSDWILDIFTAYRHYIHGDLNYFIMTSAFIVVPSILMSALSLSWYVKESPIIIEGLSWNVTTSRVRWFVRCVMLLLQLGPVLRYIDTITYGLKSRHAWKDGNIHAQRALYVKMLYEDSDAVFLRQFECFMESAPQLVLQLYILFLMRTNEYSSNWVSLAWGLTAYARSVRFTNFSKKNISILGTFSLWLWHTFMETSRVLAMALFASAFSLWVLAICFCHCLCVFMWFMIRRSFRDSCSNISSEIIYSFIFGFVYIFALINEKDEPTRLKYTIYYIFAELENTLMIVFWLVYGSSLNWYYYSGPVFHYVCFIFGLAFMLLYYSVLHPSLPNQCRLAATKANSPLPQEL